MREWSDNFVQANGITIHYHRTGGDNKPPLILLHGFTDNGLCWQRVAHDLEDTYDVIMPDARGHGRSSGIETGFSYDKLAHDVLALSQALNLDRPLLFGHSMGAMTALVLASSSTLARAIILEDPPLQGASSPPASPEQNRRAWQWIFDVKALSDKERKARCRAENPNWVEEEVEPWATSKAEFHADVLKDAGALHISWHTFVSSINCPILLITGDPKRGAIVTQKNAQEMMQLWKQGTVAPISGAGHCIHRDRYDATLAEVHAFLKTDIDR